MSWLLISIAATVGLPTFFLRIFSPEISAPVGTLLYGLGIVGGAFLLSWGTEAAQHDISQSLALAVVALIAVMPEYAVSGYFAWAAPGRPEYDAYVTANVTGANRMLVGFDWSRVVVL